MTAHCSTCRCGTSSERWFEHTGARCSNCSWRGGAQRMSVVLRVTDRGARRYLCRACAESAGWDGTFTQTSTDRLLQAQDAYRNGDLSLPEYLSEIDRATDEGATDQALRDADPAMPGLPDGLRATSPGFTSGTLGTYGGLAITSLAAPPLPDSGFTITSP